MSIEKNNANTYLNTNLITDTDYDPVERYMNTTRTGLSKGKDSRSRDLARIFDFIVQQAQKFCRNKQDLTDYVQSAIVQIMAVYEKFDARRQCKFCTFAGPWIRKGFQKMLRKSIVRDEDARRQGCEIDDLLTSDQSLESSTQLWGSREYPDTCLQITIAPDGSPKEPRLTWALEEGMMNTFKLTSAPSEGDPDGVLGLADSKLGTPLHARCVDAAVSPDVFSEGQVLNGWLNMYVSQLCSLAADREGEEGAYGLVCEEGNPAYATVSGRIWDVERVEAAGISLTHITVDIVPMDGRGTTLVHLFLHDDVLGEHKPEDDGYISCRGVLYFNPDSLKKPKVEKDLRTIKDVHSYLRYDMDLVYCIDMDGDTRLDYNDGFNILMSFKDDDVNDLDSGSQTDVQLGAIRLFSQLRCPADPAKILELCNNINDRLLTKAYYSRRRVIVEHYLLPDGSPISSHMFEFVYRRFVRDVDRINDQINELMNAPEDDDDDLDLDDLDDLEGVEPDDETPSPDDASTMEPEPDEPEAAEPDASPSAAAQPEEATTKPDQPQA